MNVTRATTATTTATRQATSRRRPSAHEDRLATSMQMPRSTTRVIWTLSSGTTVVYGDVA